MMTNPQRLNKIYDLAGDLIQSLEAVRDYEPEKWNDELEKELAITNTIWDQCRESRYLVTAHLGENGISFDFVTSEWIRHMLKDLNISQNDLAEGVNVTPQQISAWLSGTRNPSGAAQAAIFYFIKSQV
jgi:DNA-binding XRE family transcriptional regulator